MSDMTIKIQNCKNISNGEIAICEGKLNILFGRNGTGKSTIARAITLASQNKPLLELAPYGDSQNTSPKIEGVSFDRVAVFDDNYVGEYVYQKDTLLKDTFEVLIRSEEYDESKKKIDDALSKIKTTIMQHSEITILREYIGILIQNIEFTSGSNKLAKRKGGIKGVLDGRGAFFNPPKELQELSPFFEEGTVSSWADWRLKG